MFFRVWIAFPVCYKDREACVRGVKAVLLKCTRVNYCPNVVLPYVALAFYELLLWRNVMKHADVLLQTNRLSWMMAHRAGEKVELVLNMTSS